MTATSIAIWPPKDYPWLCTNQTWHEHGHALAYRSDNVGAVALGGMEKEELKGLDVSIFSRSPPEVMLDTIDHVRCGQSCRCYYLL